MKKIRHLLYLIVLIAFDQLSKYLVVIHLKDHNPINIIKDVLQLTYHENTGAIWGIASGKISMLIFISCIILFGMIALYLKIPNDKRYNLLKLVMIFITAGAIGNLIDRSIRKYVVDFIYFKLIDFPVFNIADSYITVAAIFLLILCIFYYKDEDFSFLNKKEIKNPEEKPENCKNINQE